MLQLFPFMKNIYISGSMAYDPPSSFGKLMTSEGREEKTIISDVNYFL